MRILVANLGSTSFKFKLFDMSSNEAVIAHGSADRIGQSGSKWSVASPAGARTAEGSTDLPDHAAAIDLLLNRTLQIGAVATLSDIEAVGFKAVHGGPISGAVVVDDRVIQTMRRFADVAPAHNPMYIAAMEAFAQRLPDAPRVAAFETAFHQSVPLARQVYGIPHEWIADLGIRRYGFHGASHRYIAGRMSELMPDARRVISLHLGGSSSVTAILDGKSQGNSLGLTPQSGVFHNNRVGDIDVFALLKLRAAGIDADTALQKLGRESGFLGLSGVSADLRDVERAADSGNARARLAIDAFVEHCRHYVGAYLVALGGVDAIAFTGGIGQNATAVRAAILAGLDFIGLRLDISKNDHAPANSESRIDAPDSRVAVWVLPTNEELVVARQTLGVLSVAAR